MLSHLQAILLSGGHKTVSCACLLRRDVTIVLTIRDWLNMMHFVLVLGFVSYTFCQIQFPSVDLSSSTPSPPSSPNTGFTKLSSTPTPRSAAIFFPSRQLFGLNEFGYIECQEPTDCPQDVVDTENKKVVNYFCNPLPENEGPGKACTENPVQILQDQAVTSV